MRSGELARLTGVTVRALRHYHQVGILAEPQRGSNDYRSYDVHDVIRVLRIRRLASLGIPLERMRAVLDETAENSDDLLDELDAELTGQIEHLGRQRQLIASLRNHDAAPDVPPELAPFLAVFASAGLPPELVRFDRDQSILLAHLVGEEGMPHLTDFYRKLSDPDLAPAAMAVSERFGRLGSESTDDEIAEMVDGFMRVFSGLISEFAESDPPVGFTRAADLFAAHSNDLLNEQQRRVLSTLEERLRDGPAPEPAG